MFTAVMIVPTGIGAVVGGHSGDATSAAHLLAACCDTLITHPNVLNASDLSSIPDNVLYVEGGMLDRMLNGSIGLLPVLSNRILVVCNEVTPLTVDAVNSARSIHGVEADILKLDKPLIMEGRIDRTTGQAGGDIHGFNPTFQQVEQAVKFGVPTRFGPHRRYDAVAIHTPVEVLVEDEEDYMDHGSSINPWGGVEAILSRKLGAALMMPVAHAPLETVVDPKRSSDPRLAPEMICGAHLVSVLNGLRRAPRDASPDYPRAINGNDIDVLVSPPCWGPPHEACRENNIPIMIVTENYTCQENKLRNDGYTAIRTSSIVVHEVRSYLEAAGALTMMRLGRYVHSVNRPLPDVKILGVET